MYPRFQNTLDFIGVNYYSRQVFRFDLATGPSIESALGGIVSELGIELYPEGLYIALEAVAAFGLPDGIGQGLLV